jgi:hypothetical protein
MLNFLGYAVDIGIADDLFPWVSSEASKKRDSE